MKWINQTNQGAVVLQTRVPAPSEGGDIRTITLQTGNGALLPVADFYMYFVADSSLPLETPEYVYIQTRSADVLMAGPDPFGISPTTGRAAINPGRWPASAHSAGARLELRGVAEVIRQLQQQADIHTHDGTTGNGGLLTEIAGVANVTLTNATGGTVAAGDVLVRSGGTGILPPSDGYLSNVYVVVADPTGATPDVSTYVAVNGAPVNVRCVGLVSVKVAAACTQGALLRATSTGKMSPTTGAQTGVIAIAEQDSTAYGGGFWTKAFLHNRGVDVVTLVGNQELTNKKLTQPIIYSGAAPATLVTFPNTVSASTLVDTASTQNISGKTLVNPAVQVGSDATGDTYYRSAGGILAKTAIGTPDQVNTVNANGIPAWATVPKYSMENMVTNGDFRVAQQGSTFNNPINGDYTLDRWQYLQAGSPGGIRVQQYQNAPVFGGSAPTTCGMTLTVLTADTSLAAGDFYGMATRIEGYDATHYSMGMALTFWQYAVLPGKYCMSIRNGALDRSYIIEYDLAADTWTRITATIPAPPSGVWDTTTGTGLILTWPIAAGSSWYGTANTWQTGSLSCTSNQFNGMSSTTNVVALANVNLIPGPTPRDIQSRSIAVELMRCMRYYQRLLEPGDVSFCVGQAINSVTFMGHKEFITPMRVVPTISITNPTGVLVTNGTGTGIHATSITCDSLTNHNMRVLASVASGLTAGSGSTLQQFTASGGNTLIEAKAQL